jgi:hypothetical protein
MLLTSLIKRVVLQFGKEKHTFGIADICRSVKIQVRGSLGQSKVSLATGKITA